LYRKKDAPQATERRNSPLEPKKLQKEKSRPRLSPLPNAVDFGYNAKRRLFAPSNRVKTGKFDKTARFLAAKRKKIFAPTSRRDVFAEKIFPRALFLPKLSLFPPLEDAVSSNDSPQPHTERTLKWPILRT
jgi:hypothetical protein